MWNLLFLFCLQFRHSKRNVITDILSLNVDLSIKRKDGWGSKHCGTMNAVQEGGGVRDTVDSNNQSGLAPNAFLDEEGRIEVQIVIASVKPDPDDPLYLVLAFTSYKSEYIIVSCYTLILFQTFQIKSSPYNLYSSVVRNNFLSLVGNSFLKKK